MIAAALALLVAAPTVAPPANISLFLKCAAQGASAGNAHQLDMVFFDPPPTWAKGFNFFDPDKLLPAGVTPDVTNKWPALLQIELDSRIGGNSALIQLAKDGPLASTARLNVVVINAAGKPQPSYRGTCTVTEGAAAEVEFKGLMKQ